MPQVCGLMDLVEKIFQNTSVENTCEDGGGSIPTRNTQRLAHSYIYQYRE